MQGDADTSKITRTGRPVYIIDPALKCAPNVMRVVAEMLWACGYSQEAEAAHLASEDIEKWQRQNQRELKQVPQRF